MLGKIVSILIYFVAIVGTAAAIVVAWRDQPADVRGHVHFSDYYHVVIDPARRHPAQRKDGVRIEAPVVRQQPELDRGCEVASLTMLLKSAGVRVDKMTLAKEIKKDPAPRRIIDGQVHFGNPNVGFVGDIYSYEKPGLGVYHGPIADLARRYLHDRVVDLTGKGFQVVQASLSAGKPVWVIVSSTFKKVPDEEWETWVTDAGTIRVTKKEHAVLLTGYDRDAVYFNDPLTGEKNRRADKSDFLAAWHQFGGQAVSYK